MLKLYTAHEYWLICPTHALFAFNRSACTRRRCLACTLHAGRPPQFWRHTGFLQRRLGHVDRFLMPSRFALEQHARRASTCPWCIFPVWSLRRPYRPRRRRGRPTLFPPCRALEKLKGAHDLLQLFGAIVGPIC